LEPVAFANHPLQSVFNTLKVKTAEVSPISCVASLWRPHARLKGTLPGGMPCQENRVKYALGVTKFDRLSYNPRQYVLVLTNKAVYILYPETFKLNVRIDFTDLVVSKLETAPVPSPGFIAFHRWYSFLGGGGGDVVWCGRESV
jgi:hypothetical protein